jgi:hypothetical protein
VGREATGRSQRAGSQAEACSAQFTPGRGTLGRLTSRRRPARHRASARVRRRRAVAAALVVVIGGGLWFTLVRDHGVERVCSRPDDLRTRDGITLVADAMDALRRAETTVGRPIDVVESYRSCRQQAIDCVRICGSRQGCPGRCAPPGLSWHQRGEAIDITQRMLDTPGVIGALEDSGWCQAVPDTDPGHFSFDGCH